MIRIATIELTKYARTFVVFIVIYFLVLTILESRLEAKAFFTYGTFDLHTFTVVNSAFITVLTSAIPLTIVLNVCNEFKNGYALKLISNGLSRAAYCSFKFILAGSLAIISMLLYLLVVSFLLAVQKATYFDTSIFIGSLIRTVLFSMFFSSIAISLALLLRTWQYALLVYYAYLIIETFLVLRFQETAPWIKYLPFNLAVSIFQLQAAPQRLSDYLLPATILIPFCSAVVWCCTHFFRKADL